jgi:hypothetical protein
MAPSQVALGYHCLLPLSSALSSPRSWSMLLPQGFSRLSRLDASLRGRRALNLLEA